MNTKLQLILLLTGVIFASAPAVALADPMSDEVLKFQQVPMIATQVDGAIFFGHDELSTSWGDHSTGLYGNNAAFPSQFMADDFADTVSTPVVHVRWWGSYINNQPFNHVQKFLISFEADQPALPGTFSYPTTPLLSQVVVPGAISQNSGTFTETFVHPGSGQVPGGEALYMYNAELAIPFPEQADTVYWLKIVALVDPNVDGQVQWGWHNRDYTITDTFASPNVTPGEFIEGVSPGGSANVWHFQDDSISGLISGIDLNNNSAPGGIAFTQHLLTFIPQMYVDNVDGPMGISAFSKDLAFELFTRVPEPSTYALGVLGLLALMVVGRRKWKRSCGASTRELRPTHNWTRSRFALSRKRLAHLAIAGALLLVAAQTAQAQPSYSIDFQSTQASGGGVPEGGVLVSTGTGMFPAPATAIPPGAGGLGVMPTAGGIREVDALSYGTEPMLMPGVLLQWELSVDEFAVGIGGNPFPSVSTEGALGTSEAAADIYASPTPAGPIGVGVGTNVGMYDGNGGLTPFAAPGLNLREPNPYTIGSVPDITDNLDAWESGTAPSYPVYYSMDASWADPLESPFANSGTAIANGFAGSDVVVTTAPGGPPVLYAAGTLLGLDKGAMPMPDDLDALVLGENGTPGYQPTTGPYSWLGVGGTDMLLYSVRRGSGVIGTLDAIFGIPIEEGDILVPVLSTAIFSPGIFMNAERLGLATVRSGTALTIPGLGSFGDDLDALDVIPAPVPEPSSLLLLACGGTMLAVCAWRRHQRQSVIAS